MTETVEIGAAQNRLGVTHEPTATRVVRIEEGVTREMQHVVGGRAERRQDSLTCSRGAFEHVEDDTALRQQRG